MMLFPILASYLWSAVGTNQNSTKTARSCSLSMMCCGFLPHHTVLQQHTQDGARNNSKQQWRGFAAGADGWRAR